MKSRREAQDLQERFSIAEHIIANSPSVAFLWKNQEGWPVADVSENVLDLLGYSADEFVSGKIQFASVVHPDDLDRVAEEVKQFSIVEQLSNFEHQPYRLIHKDGSTIWVDDSTNVNKNGDEITHYSGLITDVTEKMVAKERLIQLEEELDAQLDQLRTSEQKLRDRELRFESLNNISGHGVIIQDINGNVTEANQAICNLLGYSLDDFRKLTAFDIYPSHALEKVKKHHDILITEGHTYFESDILTKTGEVLQAEVFSKIMELSDGPVIETIFKDITGLKKRQQEIQTLNAAIDQSANSVVMTDLEGTITYVNERLLQITGYKRDEVLGQKPSILKSNKHSKAFYQDMWTTIKSGEIWTGDIINKKKDGSHYIESVTISPIKDAKNNTTGYLSVKEDVTERRKLNEIISAERERYQFLTDFVPHILWAADPNGMLTFVNKSGLEIMGTTEEELLSSGWFKVIHPDDILNVEKKWTEAIKNSTPYENEQRIKTGKGTYDWFKVTANPHYDENGEIDQWVGLSTSIQTEKNYLERVMENEQKVVRIFNNVTDGYISYNQEGRILTINKSGKVLLGLNEKVPVDSNLRISDFYLNKDQLREESTRFTNERLDNEIVEIQTANNESKLFDFNKVRIKEDEDTYIVEASFREVSEKYNIDRLVNASLALHESAGKITYDQLIQFGIDSCEALLQSEMAFFHLITEDQVMIKLTQWSTNTKKTCAVPDLQNHYPLKNAGNWADCVRLRKPVIHNDYATAENKKGLPDGHIPLKRDLEVPIMQDGKVVAIIGVGN
ncbi:MAG: PAS domain S-box protein, partial [Ekhidna sp.]|nr:PAS domain S-box protein [Ekhidna sp.]